MLSTAHKPTLDTLYFVEFDFGTKKKKILRSNIEIAVVASRSWITSGKYYKRVEIVCVKDKNSMISDTN